MNAAVILLIPTLSASKPSFPLTPQYALHGGNSQLLVPPISHSSLTRAKAFNLYSDEQWLQQWSLHHRDSLSLSQDNLLLDDFGLHDTPDWFNSYGAHYLDTTSASMTPESLGDADACEGQLKHSKGSNNTPSGPAQASSTVIDETNLNKTRKQLYQSK